MSQPKTARRKVKRHKKLRLSALSKKLQKSAWSNKRKIKTMSFKKAQAIKRFARQKRKLAKIASKWKRQQQKTTKLLFIKYKRFVGHFKRLRPAKAALKFRAVLFWAGPSRGLKKFASIKADRLRGLIRLQTTNNRYQSYLTQSLLNLVKRQYTKKIISNKHGWWENKYLTKAKIMRKRLGRLSSRFRKIKKNNAFNILFFRQFYTLTNWTYQNFQFQWQKQRRGNNGYCGPNQLVSLFSIRLLLSAPNILFLLGYTTSISAGTVFVQSGGVVYNGKVCNQTSILNPGDCLQLNPMFKTKGLTPYKQLTQIPFLQT